MEALTLTRPRLMPRSRRLLAAFSDERLAVEAKRGNDSAFEVIYDRHHRGLLTFCRHMLRSQDDAEDALQQTFASAFGALSRTDQAIQLKPWLYTIARNRCITMLRARREHPVEEVEVSSSTAAPFDTLERRAELRELLSDLDQLPERQRAALVLSEIGALAHPEIAQVLGCETKQVKALVFQARSALIEDRRAREVPCVEVREHLATATAGELRRRPLRRHLRQCEGCAQFREDVRGQRRALALALPVAPSLGLKESALAAAGIASGKAAGGGGVLAAGLGASGALKLAAIGVAAGGALAGVAATDPSLVDKAQAAVKRAADGVGSVVSGSSVEHRGEEARADKANGFSARNATRGAPRQRTGPHKKAGRVPISRGEQPRRAGRDEGRGGSQSRKQTPRRAHAYGRGGDKPGSKG
ncbi:MAG TPA: sigma-70 family RNA polymerase sigma factor, partial [Thermoleophilaceae bacterium]|nr:sigma-70 family RNA polymerase sigma factor [Thermoleophilaceae bacterium]